MIQSDLKLEIIEAFRQSQQPSQLKQAELKLNQLEKENDFIQILIELSIQDQLPAIYLKNYLKKQKQILVTGEILVGIQKSTTTKKIMTSCLQVILSKIQVLDLLLPLKQIFQSQDYLTGTLILVEVVKHYQWYQGEKRQVLNAFIRDLFPGLLLISSKLIEQVDNHLHLQILKNVAKIYSCATRMEMSPEMMGMDWIVPWASCFLRIVEMKVANYDDNPSEITWKLKKWAYTCLNSMMGRYALARKRDKKYSSFSKSFIADFAPKILSTYLSQIQLQLQGQKVSPRVTQSQLVFIEFCVRSKSTFTHVEPHLEILIKQVILPLLYFSKDDLELWQDDQIEYVHKKIDPPLEDFKSPQVAAEDLIEAFVRHRSEKTFVPLMTLLNTLLTSNPPPEVKYGLLTCLAKLSEHCQTSESLSPQLAAFLTQHVISELGSPHDFLKSKACDTLVQYGAVELPQETITQILSVLTNLLNHQTLSCRVSASLALAPLFKYEYVTEALRPHAVVVMQTLMSLTEMVQLDTLTGVMETFVYEFSTELAPFASQLATRLVSTFMEIMGEDSEDRQMAAAGVIKTLDGLVMSLDGRGEMLAQLELVIVPLVGHALQNSLLDLYEEIMEMVCTMLYCAKGVSPTLWQLFPQLVNVLEENVEYLEDMCPLLDNYIGFGAEVIKGNREMQDMLVAIVKKCIHDPDGEESDRIRAMLIMESMMLNLRGGIDHVIPEFVEIGYTLLVKGKVKTRIYRVHLIEVILNALCYNVGMGLSLLEHISWTGPFLELWFKNLDGMKRVHDKKLSIVVICQILTMNADALPPILKNVVPQLVSGLLKVFASYDEALKERTRLENGDFKSDDGNDFADYEYGEDDEWDDDGKGEMNELSQLVDQAAAYAPTGDEDSEDGDWDVEEFMLEDVSFSTILDKVDAYVLLTKTIDVMSSDGRAAALGGSLSVDQQKFLEACVAKGRAVMTTKEKGLK